MAEGKVTWEVRGRGLGHGVGMGAYGAYGYAKHGFGHAKILGHYYTGTRITKLKGAPRVRVLLAFRSGDVSFSKATSACGRKLSAAKSYRARRTGSSVLLVSRTGRSLARCGRRMHAGGKGRVRIGGLGAYRGALEVVPSSRGVSVVNQVEVDDYAQGSLPAEVPPSWPGPTLRAFAIAMRSIGLSSHVGGKVYNVYSDTRSQLYRGIRAETKRTNAAVRATRSQVITYKGRIAQTTYFPSSGGRTESGFLGAPKVPYLKSVADPYDYYAPQHQWTFRFSQAEMNSRLGPYLRGSLRRIKVTKRGDSPRIVWARLIGTRGTTRIRGDRLSGALGLYDRWAYFKKVG